MIHDPHLWLPAIKAALLGVMLIALVYRLSRTLDRRQVERKKADHYRLLVDLGEARRLKPTSQQPPRSKK